MDVILFSLFLFIIIFIIKRNRKREFFVYFLLFSTLLLSINLYILNDFGFLPGKEDQYGYYNYAMHTKEYFSDNFFDMLYTIAIERNFHNFLYWALYVFVAKTSIVSTIIGMRIINFLAHLGIIYFAYKSIKIINSKFSNRACLLGFSPSLLVFDIYVIRDMLILFFFSGSIYYIIKYYYKKLNLLDFIIFILFMIGIFSLRGQLSFVLFIMFLLIFFNKKIKIKSFSFYIFIIIAHLLLLSNLPLNMGGFSVLKSLINSFCNFDFIIHLLWKFPLYILGLGFLDPTTPKSASLIYIVFSRLLSFDSIIIPFLFILFLIKGYYRKDFFIKSVLFAYSFYFSIYMYAEYYWGHKYGFHFRAFIPFFYIFYIYVLSHVNLWRLRYGKKVLLSY